MLRITCIGVLVLLIQAGRPVSAQSVTMASPQVIGQGTTFWVSIELRKQATVRVEMLLGAEPAADALTFSDPGTFTKPMVLKRQIPPQNKLELRYSPADPATVPRIGVSNRLYADGTAFNTHIDAVHCDAAECRICYDLRDDSNVNFDSYPENKPVPVRHAFEYGGRKQGKRQSKWDQKADVINGVARKVDPGPYFINLVATSSSDPAGTRTVSQVFQLPAAPPSTAACPVDPSRP